MEEHLPQQEHTEGFYTKLDLASCKILVYCSSTFLYGTGYSNNKLTTQFTCFCKAFLVNAAILKNSAA